MEKIGTLRKMISEFDDPIKYWLNLDKQPAVALSDHLGDEIELIWTGEIHCIRCAKLIPKTFGQGFCYDCFMNAPEAAPCIIRPELCEAHLGKGRDVEWEIENHNKPHLVYLAQTSAIKVGVTRTTQMPTRWIDQGAQRAVAIANVPYRQLAGAIEVELKQYLSDRTDWRKMLTHVADADLLSDVRDTLISFFPKEFEQFASADGEIKEFKYPVAHYPDTIRTIKLEDERSIRRTLTGIRGQYLYFDGNWVINIRKYSGYRIRAVVPDFSTARETSSVQSN